jgi:L-cysteine desulfidase
MTKTQIDGGDYLNILRKELIPALGCTEPIAVAGMAYLYDESFEVIGNTPVNTLANVSGIICDGAKSSCAAKIASAVDAAILGLNMARQGNVFLPGDGIVKKTPEETVKSVCRLARDGMRETNNEILRIMIEKSAADAVETVLVTA